MADLQNITVDSVTDNSTRVEGLKIQNGTSGSGVIIGCVDGSGYIGLGDWPGGADNVWVIFADDQDNYLKFRGTETDQEVSTLATQASGTALGTNYVRAFMRGSGAFVAPHEARYYSSWYAVNADDQRWNVTHGLNPAPTVGWVESAEGNSTACRTTGHYAQVCIGLLGDQSAFGYDATGWTVSIDDDVSQKGFHTAYNDQDRSSIADTGYQFRIVLM